MKAYNGDWSFVATDSSTTPCNRLLEVPNANAFVLQSTVHCSLPAKLSSPNRYAEITGISEALFFW